MRAIHISAESGLARARSVLALGAAITILVSCSAGTNAAKSPSTQAAGPSTTPSAAASTGSAADSAMLVLPFAPVFAQSEHDEAALKGAVDALATKCMRDQGYPYPLFPLDPVQPLMTARYRYGGFADGQAAQLGYRDPNFAAVAARETEVAKIEASLPQDQGFYDALNGAYDPGTSDSPPPDTIGCVDSAQTDIYGAPGGFNGLADYQQILALQIESINQLYSSEEGLAVVRDWSDCMSSAGYSFSDLVEPTTAWPWTAAENRSPSANEIKMATTDARCRSEFHVETRLFEIESVIQNGLIEQNGRLLDGYADEKEAAIKRANESLGET